MKRINLIVIGKNKDKNLIALENEYLKRITNPEIKIIELKPSDDPIKNDQNILSKIKSISNGQKFKVILLEESGKEYTSSNLSKWMENLYQEAPNNLFFIIGGSQGHGEVLKNSEFSKISLSKLTLPHRFVRLIFIEQIYRTQTILSGHPYHK